MQLYYVYALARGLRRTAEKDYEAVISHGTNAAGLRCDPAIPMCTGMGSTAGRTMRPSSVVRCWSSRWRATCSRTPTSTMST
jgi:hypothetical protein